MLIFYILSLLVFSSLGFKIKKGTNVEVNLTPPNIQHEKLQQMASDMLNQRQKKEKDLMQKLKASFEDELIYSGQLIGVIKCKQKTVDKYFKFLEDPVYSSKMDSYKFLDNLSFRAVEDGSKHNSYKVV